MNGTTFDALAAARNLEAAGLGREQAEAIAAACRQAAGTDHHTLATKADVAAVKADVAAVKADVAAVKADIAAVKWVLGFVAVFVVAMSARLFGII